MRPVETTLKDILTQQIEGMGYEFVGCELQKQSSHGSLLRIFIDKEKGVTIDDCSKVSRQVSAVLDVEDPIQGPYTLEVSSPGLDRPLFEIAHYQKFIGSKVKVRSLMPINDRRNFVGILLRVEKDNIILEVDNDEIMLPFANIEKAKLIADVG